MHSFSHAFEHTAKLNITGKLCLQLIDDIVSSPLNACCRQKD